MQEQIRPIATSGEAQTEAYAAEFAAGLRPGDVVALTGELGSGKTCFVRGVCQGLSILEPVLSPTFSLLNVYTTGRLPVYHMDVYGLREASECLDIGLEEILDGNGICLIEWAERIRELLPEKTIWVNFSHAGGDRREIRVSG